MNEPSEGGFLGRWSERKRRGTGPAAPAPPAAQGDAERAPDGAPSESDAAAAPDADVSDAGPNQTTAAVAVPVDAPPPLTDADMPPVSSLEGDSDVSAFFSDGVSAALRRAALRQVFRAARFNVRDGLNDYDGDYTTFEPLGDTVTADMKFHAARRERLAREAAEREEAERLATLEDDVDVEAANDAGGDGAEADRENGAADPAPSDSVDAPADETDGVTDPDDAEAETDTAVIAAARIDATETPA